jgi:hypothetical protein
VDARLVRDVGRRRQGSLKAQFGDYGRAAIAYFALFSLFPLTLLSISIASFSLGPLMDQQLIVQKLDFIAPALGQLLGQNIDEIIRARRTSYQCRFSWADLVCLHSFLHAYPDPERNLGQ